MSKLVIRDPKGGERTHELVDPITTVGRGSKNTIQCKDREASRQHCRIEQTDSGYRLVDNRSRNGTILNGQKTDMQDLRPGDVITIGDFKLQYDPPEGVEDEDFAATVEVSPLSEKEAAAPRSSGGGGDGKPQYVLEVFEGSQAGQRFELGNETLTIGRNSANKFKLDDESGSSFHAEINKEPTGYFITDLGSTNGTRVAGEKIVKTRLGPGTEIQIGTTKMRFVNVGAPAEEDEVFGTVVLDTERLERELAEDEVRARTAFIRRAAMGVAGIVAVVGIYFVGKAILGGAGGDPSEEFPGNVLENSSFGGGTGNQGEPEGWRVEAGRYTPWSVKKVDRVAGTLEENAAALVVAREGEARIDEYTQCRARKEFDVKAGKSYQLGGWIKAPDAQGAYGFRVTWMPRRGVDRTAVEQAYVTGSQNSWKQKCGVFTPPSWATRAVVSCFAIGNRGSVFFDDVHFAPVAKSGLTGGSIGVGRLKADFSPSGVFDIMSGTETAVRKGELFFVGSDDAETRQEYADAEEPRSDARSSVFAGLIPEFASTGLITYSETVRPGEFGLVAEYDLSSDIPVPVARAGVRFTVSGAYGYGTMEVLGADGPVGGTSGDFQGAREVVFTVDDDTKLVVGIGEGQNLRIEPRGNEKYIEVTLAGAATLGRRPARLQVEFNESSRVERLAIEVLLRGLKTAEAAKDFNGMIKACKAIIKLKDRFPKEAADAERKLRALEAEAKAVFDKADALLARAEGAVGSDKTFQVLKAEFDKMTGALEAKYADGPFAQRIVNLKVKMAELEEKRKRAEEEKQAQRLLAECRPLIENNPDMAIRVLAALEARFPNSDACETAKRERLRERAEEIIARNKGRQEAYERVVKKIGNWVRMKEYEQALRIMRSDHGYVKYKDWEKFVELEKDLEEKARQKKNEGGE